MINGDKVVADYLREVDGVPRVVVRTPDNQSTAWVRLTRLAAPSETEPIDHLIRFMFQLDCYAGKAGGYPEAQSLASTVRDALKAMPGVHDGAVVTGTQCIGDAYLPDTDFEPDRERFSLTFYVWMHEA